MPVEKHAGGEQHPGVGGEPLPVFAAQVDLGHRQRIVVADAGQDRFGDLAEPAAGLGEQRDPNGDDAYGRRSADRSASILSVGKNIVYLGAPP